MKRKQFTEKNKNFKKRKISSVQNIKNDNLISDDKSEINNKTMSDFFIIKESNKNFKSESTTKFNSKENNIIDLNKTIENEVKSARKLQQLSLINKEFKNKVTMFQANNQIDRDNFNKIIFPVTIKANLGINNNNITVTELNELMKNLSNSDGKNLFIELKLLVKEHEGKKTWIDKECINLVLNTSESNLFNKSIGYISNEVSQVIKSIINLDMISYFIILDTNKLEIYIFVTFRNLEIYSNIEFINNSKFFYKFKNSYNVPSAYIKIINELVNCQKYVNLNQETNSNENLISFLKNLFSNSKSEKLIENSNQNSGIFKEVININTDYDNEINPIEEDLLEDESLENEDKINSNFSQFQLAIIGDIFEIASNFNFLFSKKELVYVDKYKNEISNYDKEILSKFLTRSNIWLNKKKLSSSVNDNLDLQLEKLISLNLLSDVNSLFEIEERQNFKSELFTFLFYLTNDEIKMIQNEINLLTKFSQKLNSNEMVCKEIFLNNSFFRVSNYLDFEIFKKLCSKISDYVSKFNFENKSNNEIGKNRLLGRATNQAINSAPNIKYISNFLNSTNFKKVKISKINFTSKMTAIFNLIKNIEYFLNDKSSNLLENFINRNKNKNLENSENIFINKRVKYDKVMNILKKYKLYTLNSTFAKVFDCATRLYFFYSDYRDVNGIVKEFFGYENFEKFENFLTNIQILKEKKEYLKPIFTNMKEFKMYDNLFQIKTAIQINSMIYNNPDLNYFLANNFCLYLMHILNPILYENIKENKTKLIEYEDQTDLFNSYSKGENQSWFNHKKDSNLKIELEFQMITFDQIEKLDQINDKLINLLLNTEMNYAEDNFLVKYKAENLSAEILNYFAEYCEKVKNYSFAAFIFLFLLLSKFLYKKRGLWWYRLILIYNKYLKNKSLCEKLINVSVNDIHIKSGYLIKIKKYIDNFEKERIRKVKKLSKKTKNLSKDKEENLNQIPISKFNLFTAYDESIFISKKRSIQADSVFSNSTGRRLYSIGNNIVTVEEFALNYYNKNFNYKGVHGENMILPALYNIFFWDIIFYDKIPFIFQSPYQTYPLDFFSNDFYKNRKEIIDRRLKEISNFKKDEIISTIENIFKFKKNLKSVFIQWNRILNDANILINIAVAISGSKLSLIFEEFSKNLKFMIKGMPDLFLWKDKNLENSALLVEVKSRNDKLSDHQKFWLHFLTEINQDVEILHIE